MIASIEKSKLLITAYSVGIKIVDAKYGKVFKRSEATRMHLEMISD